MNAQSSFACPLSWVPGGRGRLLTARLPFESDTLGGLMAKVLQEDPVMLAVRRSDVPPEVAAIVARCL